MVRIDNAVLVLHQIGDDPWIVHRSYDRSDLMGEVQLVRWISIPDCSYSSVSSPSISELIPNISTLILESNASLTIFAGDSLVVNLIGENAGDINKGMIDNYGTLILTNAQGKNIINENSIITKTGGNVIIEN